MEAPELFPICECLLEARFRASDCPDHGVLIDADPECCGTALRLLSPASFSSVRNVLPRFCVASASCRKKRALEDFADHSSDVVTSPLNYLQRVESFISGPASNAPLWFLGIASIRIAFVVFLTCLLSPTGAFLTAAFLSSLPATADG